MLLFDYGLSGRNSGPSFSVSDKRNSALRYAGNNSERMSWDSLRQKLAYIHNSLRSKFVSRLFLAAKVDQSSLPLVLCVSGKANPLKIFREIVELVAVDVVYGQPFCVPRNKSYSNKTVKKVLRAFPLLHRRHFKIPVLCNARRKLTLFERGYESLPFPVTGSRVRAFEQLYL